MGTRGMERERKEMRDCKIKLEQGPWQAAAYMPPFNLVESC